MSQVSLVVLGLSIVVTLAMIVWWWRNNRVVPLDNFMIYKDIIRLDRPD